MTTVAPMRTQFTFEIEYLNENEELLARRTLAPSDFANAIRDVRFDAFRLGLSSQYVPSTAGAQIEPEFPAERGTSPRTTGFHVTVDLEDGKSHSRQFETKYFQQSANRLRAEMLRNEQMTSEQEVYFRVNAFLDDDETELPAKKLDISLDPVSPISLTPGSRRDYGPAQAWDDPIYADISVVIDKSSLEESVEEARANPDREIAGFLLGHFHGDDRSKEIFLAVTGLASAGATAEASETSVTYTPSSFAHVREMIKLRGAGESVVGWYHSHPFKLCAECPLPTPPECLAKVLFYSQDDLHLMETTFEHPFMVGLLVAVEPRIEDAVGHLPVKLYGWREGQIQERGFEVVGDGE